MLHTSDTAFLSLGNGQKNTSQVVVLKQRHLQLIFSALVFILLQMSLPCHKLEFLVHRTHFLSSQCLLQGFFYTDANLQQFHLLFHNSPYFKLAHAHFLMKLHVFMYSPSFLFPPFLSSLLQLQMRAVSGSESTV